MDDTCRTRKRSLVPLLALLAAVIGGLALLARFGVDMDDIRALVVQCRQLAADRPLTAALLLGGAIFLCGVFTTPLKGALNLAGGALLGPAATVAVVLAGILAGSSVLFHFTRRFLRRRVEQRMGGLARRVEGRLTRRPILAIAGLRLMIALPYGPITMAAAVSSVRYRDFLLGGLLGDLPVIVLYAVAGDRLTHLADVSEAISPVTAAILVGAGALLLAASLWGRRSLDG